MATEHSREIPYNYTSADDGQIVRHLFGSAVWYALERIRFQRRTGQRIKLLMRFMGEMFILRRNPFIYQDLIDSAARHSRFFRSVERDLDTVAANADGIPELETILTSCRAYLSAVETEVADMGNRRSRIRKALGTIVGNENVFFDPFTLISHATDATDWRLHLPLAVVRPAQESQIAPLLNAVAELGLHVIPRGAGTGLTGGSVPVHRDCVIINTEKLNRIRCISQRTFTLDDGRREERPVLCLESGVITGHAMDYAAENGLVFATDPTSAWACTIGGNIAENAGGKTAVLWGTAIDNLLLWRIAMPGGRAFEVRRLDHPCRKIRPEDTVRFAVTDQEGRIVRRIELSGTDIRRPGLGKDITNKALGGLPGVQKEGTDGIITSAEFILHSAYPGKTTFCLEFFGDDMDEASRVITCISEEFVNRDGAALMALEHFDEEYVRAIDYKVKAARSESPKAVLLIDMVGRSAGQIGEGTRRLERLLANYPNTFLFTARDEAEAQRFWRDRKRLGAIAARTNAFKLNEDVVVPIAALAEFSRFVDHYNIEEERYNQKLMVWQLGAYLEKAEPIEDPKWLEAKLPKARELFRETLKHIDLAGKEHLRQATHVENLMADLRALFKGFTRVCGEMEQIREEIRTRLIVIATHMHAGDGNVHVNIPVFSNDRDMMSRAAETADAVMAKTVELGGVVSGEHGIGFTKLKYLDPERLAELADYRHEIDPDNVMNPGKLADLKIPDRVFTPSFNLLGLEARILRHGSLENLAERISKCVRCGKCKANCCVFYPARNLFFHPRNKNLALGALIEALLYEAQRSHSTRFESLRHLEEIAEHCTICHKCHAPCPVDIDTGRVSILEREILSARQFKRTALPTRASLAYLENRNPAFNSAFRKAVLQWGGAMQRLGVRLTGLLPGKSRNPGGRIRQLLETPLPPPSRKTLHDGLPAAGDSQALLVEPDGQATRTVFYFPGCGSERLFGRVGRATLFILLKSGSRVVLPPPFLCCGFPARVNAKEDMNARMTLRNAILFSQIRDMFGWLAFDACVVSCGTCRESLEELGVTDIFDARLTDASRFALDNGLALNSGKNCLYHTPCHDSLDGGAPTLLEKAGRYTVQPVAHCCAEAGTLALSRPDIANAMRRKKTEAIAQALAEDPDRNLMLTNCPACLQGLGRHRNPPIEVRHITEELARNCGGDQWQAELARIVDRAEVVSF